MPDSPTTSTRTSHARFDAIVCDIDGCLISEKTGPMDLDRMARIAAWNRAAQTHRDRPTLTLCSGRPITAVEMMCRAVGNVTLPAVGEMGVFLYLPAQTGFEMDPAITSEHRGVVDEARAWAARTLVPEGMTIQPGKHASVSLYHPQPRLLHEKILPRVEAITAERAWPLRVSATWEWINWDLRHISKSTGVDRLASKAGLDAGRLAGIGDTMSDMAIRERVAWFACPANAADELKKAADYVSPHDEAEGVVDILHNLPS